MLELEGFVVSVCQALVHEAANSSLCVDEFHPCTVTQQGSREPQGQWGELKGQGEDKKDMEALPCTPELAHLWWLGPRKENSGSCAL